MKKYKSIGKFDNSKRRYIHIFSCKICGCVSKFEKNDKTWMTRMICRKHTPQNEWRHIAVKFVNINNGKVSSAKSIADFCRQHKSLGKNAKYHFTPVIQKERLHYKGWMLPETAKTIDTNKVRRITQTLVSLAVK